MRKQIFGTDYGLPGSSSTFVAFLSGLEKVKFDRISSRSLRDQERVTEMAKFVHALAHWHVFATFTFPFSASVRTATKCFEKFIRGALPNVSVFFVIEMHPGGHGGHVHALFDCPKFPRNVLWAQWKKRYGINRIELINGFDAVCDYCAKYVCKDHAWWNFSLSPQAFHNFRKRDISFPLSDERNVGGYVCNSALDSSERQQQSTAPHPRASGVTPLESTRPNLTESTGGATDAVRSEV